MEKTKKAIILLYIESLIRDCDNQINSLEHYRELSWDCKDMSNWNSMLDLLEKIKSHVEDN